MVNDNKGEWFELYNPNGPSVDINGWELRDNSTNTHIIDNGGPLIVPDGGYLVLGNNGDINTNGGVPVDYAYPNNHFMLHNAEDELILIKTVDGTVCANMPYNDVTFPNTTGYSMNLISPELDISVGANWCESATTYGDGDHGTPGQPNTHCIGSPTAAPSSSPSTSPTSAPSSSPSAIPTAAPT